MKKLFLLVSLLLLLVCIVIFLNSHYNKISYIGQYYPKSLCNGSSISKEFSQIKENPLSIKIDLEKDKKWYINIFLALDELRQGAKKIPLNFKNYNKANIKVSYPNDIICNFKAEIRINGSNFDHIKKSKTIEGWNFESSIRVKILNGHINGINIFKLMIPETKNYDNEIFTTSLLNSLDFIAPMTFYVDATINNHRSKMIFQEHISDALLNSNLKSPGPILAGNKINRFGDDISRLGLTRIQNFGGLINGSHQTKMIFLNALDKLNYIYLNYRVFLNSNNLNEFITFPGFSELFFNDFEGYEKMSSFESLLLSMGGKSGLTPEDRRFYYDPIKDRFEPIYNDGMVRILDNFEILEYLKNNKRVSNYIKYGAEKSLKSLRELNIFSFNNLIINNGLNYSIEDTKKYITLISKNLISLINFENSKYVFNNKELFTNESNPTNAEIKLAFEGSNNTFEICDFNLDNCFLKKTSKDNFSQIIKNQITKIDGLNILFVRLNKHDFENNKKPKITGFKSMKKINLDDQTNIYTYSLDNVLIDKKMKIINIFQKNKNDRVLFMNGSIKNWRINFNGNNISKPDNVYSQDANNINGCITFLDLYVENIEIYGENFDCPNAVHFINTYGIINTLALSNSKGDAFDSDFSNLLLNKTNIKNTGNECIGVKRGNYEFSNIVLDNCGDKSISSGEFAKVKILNIQAKNSPYGLFAKDSGYIYMEKGQFSNVDLCMWGNRQKSFFSGGLIEILKDYYYCENNSYLFDKDSTLISNN